ncbi:MAG: hypothetical protein E7609_04305 [Ruminococcaceae bacterium]|nr:hypothetical protein [Oscillospiraceae bacterium]
MKKILFFTLILCLCAPILFSACAPAYRDDARTGTYVAYGADGKRVDYRLTLEEDGTGEIIHYPHIGGETREDIIFELRDDVLNLHGTEVVGGVIGRNELTGTVELVGNEYTFELRGSSSGAVFANFVRE